MWTCCRGELFAPWFQVHRKENHHFGFPYSGARSNFRGQLCFSPKAYTKLNRGRTTCQRVLAVAELTTILLCFGLWAMGGFLLEWRVPHFSTPLYEYVAGNARNVGYLPGNSTYDLLGT